MLVGQQELHTSEPRCDRRFSSLVRPCTKLSTVAEAGDGPHPSSSGRGHVPLHAVGHDPAFLSTSSSYRPELQGRQGSFYNISSGAGEARAGSLVPYGFFRGPLPQVDVLFPVVFQVLFSLHRPIGVTNPTTSLVDNADASILYGHRNALDTSLEFLAPTKNAYQRRPRPSFKSSSAVLRTQLEQ